MQWPVPCSASLVLVEIPQHSLELEATLMAPAQSRPADWEAAPSRPTHDTPMVRLRVPGSLHPPLFSVSVAVSLYQPQCPVASPLGAPQSHRLPRLQTPGGWVCRFPTSDKQFSPQSPSPSLTSASRRHWNA